eukprot:TRINITY_DN10921_c0_g1_i2.p1 TRINITY_DN10921_c0_g1~~TRINITY_DN10921_c0_g1_i2.p1  ORF type:complete len:371 (+),score=66.22 TRINITY_DN10921_c0_g1_i2:165-1277(+)
MVEVSSDSGLVYHKADPFLYSREAPLRAPKSRRSYTKAQPHRGPTIQQVRTHEKYFEKEQDWQAYHKHDAPYSPRGVQPPAAGPRYHHPREPTLLHSRTDVMGARRVPGPFAPFVIPVVARAAPSEAQGEEAAREQTLTATGERKQRLGCEEEYAAELSEETRNVNPRAFRQPEPEPDPESEPEPEPEPEPAPAPEPEPAPAPEPEAEPEPEPEPEQLEETRAYPLRPESQPEEPPPRSMDDFRVFHEPVYVPASDARLNAPPHPVIYRHHAQERLGPMPARYRGVTDQAAQAARQRVYDEHFRGRVSHDERVYDERKWVLFERRTGERHPDRPAPAMGDPEFKAYAYNKGRYQGHSRGEGAHSFRNVQF